MMSVLFVYEVCALRDVSLGVVLRLVYAFAWIGVESCEVFGV